MTFNHSGFPRRHLFDLTAGLIYLDGNSLGPPVKGSEEIAFKVIDSEWKTELIRAWNTCGWIELPHTVGNLLAPIIGVSPDTISMGDTLSVKLFQVLAAAVEMKPKRKVVLTDSGNFPSDLYIANGLLDSLGRGHQLKIVKPDQVIKNINDKVAVVYLTHVDYRTGRKHDMAKITKRAHECGSVVIWDLAHSVGALPLELETVQAEFAVGCTYKYLNGGPGAPAFVYVRPDLVSSIQPVMPGWLGHKKPFSMDIWYTPAKGVGRFRIGTPSVIQFKILEHALALWKNVDLYKLYDQSVVLSELFIAEMKARCPSLELVSPSDPTQRGSQVSFASKHAYPLIQALIDRNVIGDFREPNILRFGLAPLYVDENQVIAAVQILEQIIKEKVWQQDKYQTKKKVT